MPDLKPVYLVCGDDDAKIDAWRLRLRRRAEDENGPGGLETFDAVWTKIRDSHFDASMNGVDWEAVRTELRPRAAAAKTAGELRASIREMLSRLGQSHFALIPSGSDSGSASGDLSGTVGMDVRLVGRDFLVTRLDPRGSASAAGVRPGWRINGIGGEATPDILRALPEGSTDRLIQVEAWRQVLSQLLNLRK